MAKQGKNRPSGLGRGGNAPPAASQFKPGQCGNPKGRPKGTGITDQIRKALEKDDGKGFARLAAVAIKKAEEGDPRFWQQIVDRLDGPVVAKIEATHAQTVKIVHGDDLGLLEESEKPSEGGGDSVE